MRRLAAALGVQNGATYWHFRSKQALLEAMADTLLAGLTAGLDTESPWTERITELARRLRRALLSRRDGARLSSAAFFPLPNALAYGEAVIAALGESGLSSRDAAWAADTLTYYVVGHTDRGATRRRAARQRPRRHRAAYRRGGPAAPPPHVRGTRPHPRAAPSRTLRLRSPPHCQRHPGRHRETVTERNRRSQLRSQAGHDLLGGLAAVTELAALRFAVASVSCGSRHRLTGRLAVASPSL